VGEPLAGEHQPALGESEARLARLGHVIPNACVSAALLVRVGVSLVAHRAEGTMEIAEPAALRRAVVDRVKPPDGAIREWPPVADRDRGLERTDELHVRLLSGPLPFGFALDRAGCFDRLLHIDRREKQDALPLP
jgi:hypothetical protein